MQTGDWVTISCFGGLGHMAAQHAKSMEFHVIAVDIADGKLALARSLVPDMTVNAANEDAVKAVHSAVRIGYRLRLLHAPHPRRQRACCTSTAPSCWQVYLKAA